MEKEISKAAISAFGRQQSCLEGTMEKDHLVVILERMESKLELVIEGHAALQSEIQALSQKTDERFDLVNFKIDTLNEKIDGVAADLTAHRRDTEAHRVGYGVGEG